MNTGGCPTSCTRVGTTALVGIAVHSSTESDKSKQVTRSEIEENVDSLALEARASSFIAPIEVFLKAISYTAGEELDEKRDGGSVEDEKEKEDTMIYTYIHFAFLYTAPAPVISLQYRP